MVRTAYFDCFAGAGGDMLIGSLLAAGLDEAAWRAEVRKLPLPLDTCTIEVRAVRKQGIAATKMTVLIDGIEADSVAREEHGEQAKGARDAAHHAQQAEAAHGQHLHNHEQGRQHGHHHSGGPFPSGADPMARPIHEHGVCRGVKEIDALLNAAPIASTARRQARAIFRALAVAEAKVHGLAAEAVHFHEVGALDAIIDIAGFAIGYELLGIERAIVSPFVVGQGVVRCAHGLMPVPAPAVLELLCMADAPISPRFVDGECLTPTGAAILTTVADCYAATPPFSTILSVGYGAGSRDLPDLPNTVRLVLGDV